MKSKQCHFNVLFTVYNYYKEDMPSWPGVSSVYCNYLPRYGINVELILPVDKRHLEKKKFLSAELTLLPQPYSSEFVIRILGRLLFNIRLILYLLKKLKKDKINIIQFRNDIPSAIVGLILGKIYRVPCIFNYDTPLGYFVKLYSKEKILRGIPKVIWKYSTSLFENVILKNFDFIFPITYEYKKDLKSLGIPMEKMSPFPLGIDPEIFQCNSKKSREELGLAQSDVVFIYVGSIVKERHLENVLFAFSEILKVNPNVKLIFVGDGDSRPELEKLAEKLKIKSNVLFVGRVLYSEVPCCIQIADFAISLLPPVDAYRVSSPCKLFEYLYSKVPPIANYELPEQRDALLEGKAGILSEYTVKSIEDSFLCAISLKYTNPKQYRKIAHIGKTSVVKRRHFKKIAKTIYKTYCLFTKQ